MDKHLLEILVCPICKGQLFYNEHQDELICRFDQVAYSIRNGIPIMLVNEVRQIREEK